MLSVLLGGVHFEMGLALTSIAVLLLAISSGDPRIVDLAMAVPFLVNIFLMTGLFISWKNQTYSSSIYYSLEFRAAFAHLTAWVIITAIYTLF